MGFAVFTGVYNSILQRKTKLTNQEMILTYADIRRSPCKKCNMMTDSQAQLPVVRRAVDSDIDGKIGAIEGRTAAWEAFHTGCV